MISCASCQASILDQPLGPFPAATCAIARGDACLAIEAIPYGRYRNWMVSREREHWAWVL